MIDFFKNRTIQPTWDHEVGDYFAGDSSSYYRTLANIEGDWNTKPEITEFYESKNPGVLKQNAKYNQTLQTRFDPMKLDGRESEYHRLINATGLDIVESFIHLQKPGQMTVMHYDGARCEGKLDHMTEQQKRQQVIKLFIFLDDWSPGQVMLMGSDHFAKWRKGDVLWFDWPNLPHGTANFGLENRPMLFIVGTKTLKFQELFDRKDITRIKV